MVKITESQISFQYLREVNPKLQFEEATIEKRVASAGTSYQLLGFVFKIKIFHIGIRIRNSKYCKISFKATYKQLQKHN